MPTFRQDTKIGGMVPMMKTDDINDQAITKDKIRDGNVTAEKLADGAVSTDKLPDGAIKTPKIADENITTSKLAEASVVTSKIANQNVTKEKIADQSVDNSKLSPEAVTYDKLKDKSVITEKLNDRAVTTEKVEEKAITNAKLGDQSVDGRVIREASIEGRHIGNNTVSTSKIVSRSVTTEKIAYNSVSRAELTPDVRTSIDKKADAEQVNNSLYNLEKKIGERFVVEGDVTNLPDEEDLTSVKESERDVLKLADRNYVPEKFSGKGYKILRRNIKPVSIAVTKIRVESAPSADGTLSFNINSKETQVAVSASDNTTALVVRKVESSLKESMTEYEVSTDALLITLTRKSDGSVTPSAFSASTTGVVCTVTDSTRRESRNILTAVMLNQSNTIYEIRYDFDLNGENIEMQEGCTLKFCGGSLKNGSIKFNSTELAGTPKVLCEFDGPINNSVLDITWFGAIKNDVSIDNAVIINKLINLNLEDRISNVIYIPEGTFYIHSPIQLVAYKKIILKGAGRELSVLKPSKEVEYIIGNTEDIYINANFYDFHIDGNRKHPDSTDVNEIFTYKSLAKCGFLLRMYNYNIISNIKISNIDGSGILLSKSWCSKFINIYSINNQYGISSYDSPIINATYISLSEFYQHLYNCIKIQTSSNLYIFNNTFERNGGAAVHISGNVSINGCRIENNCINILKQNDSNTSFRPQILIGSAGYFSRAIITNNSFDMHIASTEYKNIAVYGQNIQFIEIKNNVLLSQKEYKDKIDIFSTVQHNLNRCEHVEIFNNLFKSASDKYYLISNFSFLDNIIDNIYFSSMNCLSDLYNKTAFSNKNLMSKYIAVFNKSGCKETSEGYLNRRTYINNANGNYISFETPSGLDEYIGKLSIIKYYTKEEKEWILNTKNIYIKDSFTFELPLNKVFTMPELYLEGLSSTIFEDFIWHCKSSAINYYANKISLLPGSKILIEDSNSEFLKFAGATCIKYKNGIPNCNKDVLSLSKEDEGFCIYDSTLKKQIMWSGSSWVNLDGSELSLS